MIVRKGSWLTVEDEDGNVLSGHVGRIKLELTSSKIVIELEG